MKVSSHGDIKCQHFYSEEASTGASTMNPTGQPNQDVIGICLRHLVEWKEGRDVAQ